MKYKIELCNIPPDIGLLVGEADTFKECMEIIDNYLNKYRIESYVTNCLLIDDKIVVDYGSYFYFFHISHTDESDIEAWEIEIDEQR